MAQDPGAIDRQFASAAGLQIRRRRLRLGLTQAEVGRCAGVSQPMVSRIELGRGADLPLRSWLQVAKAVGVALRAEPSPSIEEPFGRRAVAMLALSGGWKEPDWESAGHDDILVLRRPQRWLPGYYRRSLSSAECAVVLVTDVVGDGAALVRRLHTSMADARRLVDDGVAVGGLLVVRRITANRRRVTETQALTDWAFRRWGAQWIGALRSSEGRMPFRPGIVWMDRAATRLIPMGLRLRAA